ncbi:MAG: hypothetical protein PHD48_10555 [Alphaproteobacteria bacterium]|nr:hypothetical protein [Alphaproteobacteria bacterium]
MTNQERIEILNNSICTTNCLLGVLGGLVLIGLGVTADFIDCANQLATPVSYPIFSSSPFAVAKPAEFTGEAQPFTGVAAGPSGSQITVSGNMVVLNDRAHYSWTGSSVPTVRWTLGGDHALSIDPATQKMTLKNIAQGHFGVSCREDTTFDVSGISVSQTVCTVLGMGPYKTAPMSADKDEYEYEWAKETITGALGRAMEMFNADLRKNSLSAGDDRFDAQMREFFVRKFSNMEPTENYSVLSPLTPSSDLRGVNVVGASVSFGNATVQIHDNGSVENTQYYDNGNKKISVLVDPSGTVQTTHRYKGDSSNLAFEFTHIMTSDDQVRGWGEYSNVKTGEVVKRMQLKPAILDLIDLKVLESAARQNGSAAQTMLYREGAVNKVSVFQTYSAG